MDRSRDTDAHHRLAYIIRDLRQEAGLTQTELAERLDRPQSVISSYENGHRRLDLVELDTIADAIGTTLEEIVRRYRAG